MAPSEPVKKPRRWWRWLRNAALTVIGLVVMMNLAVPIVLAARLTHPERAPLDGASPADVGLAYQDVRLTTTDGVSIAGWFIAGTNDAAIVMVHGAGENRSFPLPVAAMLARHGYNLLIIDMRAHGDSGGDGWSSWLAERDVLAAVDYLKTRPGIDPERIGAWGFSGGALAVIHAAARTADIKAVAADGPGLTTLADRPPSGSGQNILRMTQQWLYLTAADEIYLRGQGTPTAVVDDIAAISPRAVLLIAAGDYATEVRFARNYLARAGEPKELWIVPDAIHGEGWKTQPVEYEQRISQFFDEWLNDR